MTNAIALCTFVTKRRISPAPSKFFAWRHLWMVLPLPEFLFWITDVDSQGRLVEEKTDKWDNHNTIARGWRTVEDSYHPVTFRRIYGVSKQQAQQSILKTTASAPQLAPSPTHPGENANHYDQENDEEQEAIGRPGHTDEADLWFSFFYFFESNLNFNAYTTYMFLWLFHHIDCAPAILINFFKHICSAQSLLYDRNVKFKILDLFCPINDKEWLFD